MRRRETRLNQGMEYFALNARKHQYRVEIDWTGNDGRGTASYTSYGRDHLISGSLKEPISGSADRAFHGDVTRWNPEELLVGAISACHQLWYLHLCADAGVVVESYHDDAEGVMVEDASRGGAFAEVVLNPTVIVARTSDAELAMALHVEAHSKCFISNSLNFDVKVSPRVTIS